MTEELAPPINAELTYQIPAELGEDLEKLILSLIAHRRKDGRRGETAWLTGALDRFERAFPMFTGNRAAYRAKGIPPPGLVTGAMLEIAAMPDREARHAKADALLCDVLRSVGYGEMVDTFEAMEKWYS